VPRKRSKDFYGKGEVVANLKRASKAVRASLADVNADKMSAAVAATLTRL
jgi:hypothetical protein